MKKVKQNKLTKDQQQIHALTKQLTDLESQLRSANYRETDLNRKLAEETKKVSDKNVEVAAIREALNNARSGVHAALAAAETTDYKEVSTQLLQRIIGIVQGHLSSASNAVSKSGSHDYYSMKEARR